MVRIKHSEVRKRMKRLGRVSTTTEETIVSPFINENIGKDVLFTISLASEPISSPEIANILGLERKAVTKVLTKMYKSPITKICLEKLDKETPFRYKPNFSKNIDTENLYKLIVETRV